MMRTYRLLLSACATAMIVPTSVVAKEQRTVTIDVPAGRLDEALLRVARQAGLQLVFTDPAVADRRAPKINGRYTPGVALDLLLARSGFGWRYTGPRTVRVVPLDTASLAPVPFVQATAPAPVHQVLGKKEKLGRTRASQLTENKPIVRIGNRRGATARTCGIVREERSRSSFASRSLGVRHVTRGAFLPSGLRPGHCRLSKFVRWTV